MHGCGSLSDYSDVVLSSLIEGGGGGGDRGQKGGGVTSVFAGKCSASQEKDKEGGRGSAPTETRKERAKRRGKRELRVRSEGCGGGEESRSQKHQKKRRRAAR